MHNLHHGSYLRLTKIHLSRSATKIHYKRSATPNCQNILPARQTDPSLIELEILTSIDKLTSPADELTSAVISLYSLAHTFHCHHWRVFSELIWVISAFSFIKQNWIVISWLFFQKWTLIDVGATVRLQPLSHSHPPPLLQPTIIQFKTIQSTIQNNSHPPLLLLLLQATIQNHLKPLSYCYPLSKLHA